MIKNLTIPEGWSLLLQRLNAYGFDEAAIAGGAIRDLFMDRPIKDIDVFVRERGPETIDRLNLALAGEGKGVINPGGAAYIGSLSEVTGAWEFNLPYVSDPVQVITLENMTGGLSAISRIDFGLCRAWLDMDGPHLSDEFLHDSAAKIMTLQRSDNQKQFDRSMVRFTRLQEKYPEFRLVVPPEFRHFCSDTETPLDSGSIAPYSLT